MPKTTDRTYYEAETRYAAELYTEADPDGKTQDTVSDLLRALARDIERFEGAIRISSIEVGNKDMPYLQVTVSAETAYDLAQWTAA